MKSEPVLILNPSPPSGHWSLLDFADARATSIRQNPNALLLCGCILASAAFAMLFSSALSQTVAAVFFVVLLGSLALTRPAVAVVATFIYLAFLGDLRRFVVAQAGPTSADPMVLVGPMVAGLLLMGAVVDRQVNLSSRLAKLVASLTVVMVIQVFNPHQGGLAVGIGGAILYLTPIAWFWIGRAMGDSQFLTNMLQRVVVPIAFLAAMLGLYQTIIGFLPFENRWIDVAGDNPLIVGHNYRPFSFFVSPAEYWHYAGIGLVVLIAPLFAGKNSTGRSAGVILFAPLLLASLLLSGARGPIVSLLVTGCVLWAATGRTLGSGIARLALAIVVGAGGLLLTMSKLSSADVPPSIAPYVARQANGFLDPTNASASTAGIHQQLFLEGMAQGLVNPVGSGLGAGTRAAAKFSESPQIGTEVDLSNMMVGLGAAGWIYAVIIALVLIESFMQWRKGRRDSDHLTFAILIFELGQWLTGGHYAVAALIWFCIGTMDRGTPGVSVSAASIRPRSPSRTFQRR